MSIARIVGFSNLAPFRPGHDYRPALDEIAALGGNLARAFGGPLPWCGQEQRHVYEGLPGWFDACRERSLHGYVSYCTDAGLGYALDAHVREIEMIAAGRDNVLKEVANEADHPSQGGRLTPDRCRELAARMAGPVAFGATIVDDEADTYAGGTFVGPHLDRGRDKWNMVRRIREMEAGSARNGKPYFNQEMIGAAEDSIAGKRESDPNIFFTAGVLNVLFGVGGLFHSEDGLWARPLGPNQRLCAEAFIAGSRITDISDRFTYKNSNVNGGWGDSPVQSHNLNGCVRAYSGVAGNAGIAIALGITGDHGVRFGAGWRPAEVLADRPGVTAWRIER